MTPDYLELVLGYVSRNSGMDRALIDPDKNFVEEGYLDSLDIYGLLLSLEKDTGQKLDLTALVKAFPCTISSLVTHLQR